MLRLLTLSFCLFSLNAWSQDQVFKGSLVDRVTKNRVALAEIYNVRTKARVGSNDLGAFQILASAGDTLLVLKRNYLAKNIIVNNFNELLVYLEAEATMIEQVDIVRTTRKSDLEALKQAFKDKGSYYEGKPPLSLLNPFGGSPLTFFYELFGKTPRNARRFSRYYKNELAELTVDVHFSKSRVMEHTLLGGEELENFMSAFRPEYEIAAKWSEYDAISYIKKSFLAYKANPEAYKNKLILPEN